MFNKIDHEDFKLILNCTYQRKGKRRIKMADKVKTIVEKAATNELTLQQSKCFDLYYKEGLNVYQIAKNLQIAAPTVSVHINKARKKILSAVGHFIPQDILL